MTRTGIYFSNLWGIYYTPTTVKSVCLLYRNMKTTLTCMKWDANLYQGPWWSALGSLGKVQIAFQTKIGFSKVGGNLL